MKLFDFFGKNDIDYLDEIYKEMIKTRAYKEIKEDYEKEKNENFENSYLENMFRKTYMYRIIRKDCVIDNVYYMGAVSERLEFLNINCKLEEKEFFTDKELLNFEKLYIFYKKEVEPIKNKFS